MVSKIGDMTAQSKKRRSILTTLSLFNQENEPKTNEKMATSNRKEQEEEEHEKEKRASSSLRSSRSRNRRRKTNCDRGTTSSGRNRATKLVAENDIIIVEASEAKCVEAQIVANCTSGQQEPSPRRQERAKRGADETEERGRKDSERLALEGEKRGARNEGEQRSVMRRLFSKMAWRSTNGSTTGRSSDEEERPEEHSSGSPARSYVEELNRRIEIEKRRLQMRGARSEETIEQQRQKRNSFPANFSQLAIGNGGPTGGNKPVGQELARLRRSRPVSGVGRWAAEEAHRAYAPLPPSRSSSLSRSSASILSQRDQSPFGLRAWQTNENYVPRMSGINEVPELVKQHELVENVKSANYNHQERSAVINGQPQDARQSLGANYQQAGSPMLDQFLHSHRLRFDSLSSLASISMASSSSSSGPSAAVGSLGSTRALLADRQPALSRGQASLGSLRRRPSETAAQLAPDQRLLRWQLMAAKSGAPKFAGQHQQQQQQVQQQAQHSPQPLANKQAHTVHSNSLSTCLSSSTDCSTDDDLDQLDCCSEARLVCYCSDDTSCSSVELVWSRPQLIERRETYRKQEAMLRNLRSTRVSPQLSLVLGNPARAQETAHQQPRVQLDSRVKATSDSPAGQQSNRKLFLTSTTTPVQRAAVLELAKPSRARDRRISERRHRSKTASSGPEPEGARPQLLAELQSKHEPQSQRNSSKEALHQKGRESPVDGRCSRASSRNDWVPNPIFGTNQSPIRELDERPQRRASCLDLATSDSASLQLEQTGPMKSLDLTAKLNRCKELLLRLAAGSGTILDSQAAADKPSEVVTKEAPPTEQLEEPHSLGPETTLNHSIVSRGNGSKTSLLEGDEIAEENHFLATKNKHHRWSLRVGSAFNGGQQARQADRATDNGSSSGHVSALNRLLNIDGRALRTNVSSLRSQIGDKLSDTGKRASVLADQLITNIKDTAREQIIPLAAGLQPRDTLQPNSFASGPEADQTVFGVDSAQMADRLSLRQASKSDPNNNNNSDRSRMFSLIYLHQRQSGGGQPVITKQPRSTIGGKRANELPKKQAAHSKETVSLTSETHPQLQSAQASPSRAHRFETKTGLLAGQYKTIASCQAGLGETDCRLNGGSSGENRLRVRRIRARRLRKQFNVAPSRAADESESEEEQKEELAKTCYYGNHNQPKHGVPAKFDTE